MEIQDPRDDKIKIGTGMRLSPHDDKRSMTVGGKNTIQAQTDFTTRGELKEDNDMNGKIIVQFTTKYLISRQGGYVKKTNWLSKLYLSKFNSLIQAKYTYSAAEAAEKFVVRMGNTGKAQNIRVAKYFC